MKAVTVISGSPDDRPPGFPCIGCGEQVTEERGVPVDWPDGRRTTEAVCPVCWPRYTLGNGSDRPPETTQTG